jgi:hypothetical protein
MIQNIINLEVTTPERNIFVDDNLSFELLGSDHFWAERPEYGIGHIPGVITDCYSLTFLYAEIDIVEGEITYLDRYIFILKFFKFLHFFFNFSFVFVGFLFLVCSKRLFNLFFDVLRSSNYPRYFCQGQHLPLKIGSGLYTESIGHVDIEEQTDAQTHHSSFAGAHCLDNHDD